eukprot:8183215-Pyramimonas_sp.AAC.1
MSDSWSAPSAMSRASPSAPLTPSPSFPAALEEEPCPSGTLDTVVDRPVNGAVIQQLRCDRLSPCATGPTPSLR